MMLARERPGIYADYQASGIVWNSSGKAVGIAAKSAGEQNRAYSITRASDAAAIFGSESTMTRLCAAALQNGAAQVVAVSAGNGEGADYSAAFAVLEAQQVYTVTCDSTQTAIHQLLKESVMRASNAGKERIGFVAYGGNQPLQWAAEFACERMVLIAQVPLNEKDGCLLAAAAAAQTAKSADPAASFNGVKLEGITGLSSALSEETLDEYISAGITPLEAVSGSVEIIRAVTSCVSAAGSDNSIFRELNTVLIMDDVLISLKSALKQQMAGARNNACTRTSIATQAAVLLENKCASGIIDGYSQPKVYPVENNPTVCVVEIEFTVSRGLNQIRISTHISV